MCVRRPNNARPSRERAAHDVGEWKSYRQLETGSWSPISLACGADCSWVGSRLFDWVCGDLQKGEGQGTYLSRNVQQHSSVAALHIARSVINLRTPRSSSHYCAITDEEKQNLYTWGSNDHGQLGQNSTKRMNLPRKVKNIPGRVVHVACGAKFTFAVTDSGSIYSWGLNMHGQLGLGTRRFGGASLRPQQVSFDEVDNDGEGKGNAKAEQEFRDDFRERGAV